MLNLITFSIFFGVFFLFAYAVGLIYDRIIVPRQRIKIYTSGQENQGKDQSLTKEKKDTFALLKPISNSIEKINIAKKWDRKLRRADIPLKSGEFLAGWYLAVFSVALLCILTPKFLLLLPIILVAPGFYVSRKIAKRIKKFESQLNDALSIMANSLRAGFSFFQAMDTVSKEMPDPISKEFARSLKEMNFGTSSEDALRNMAERIGSADLDLLVTAILIQRQVGGNLAEILETISQTIRERIKILGEIRTLTAQGRMSGYIIGGLPIILLGVLYLINGEYVGLLFSNKIGWALLFGGMVSEIFGVLLIKNIVSIEV